MKSKFSIVLVVLFMRSVFLFAEKPVEDAWLWSTISIEKKITQKTSISFDEELRFFDNMSRINLYFSNIGVNYQINKSFKVALVYRFVQKNQFEQGYSKRHRLYLDIAYKRKMNDFTLVYRVRFQGQVRDYYSSDAGRNIESYMRHKVDLRYAVKKFTPYVAVECRFQFTNPGFEGGNGLWDRVRLYGGTDYKLNRQSSFGIYYMIQQDFNNERIERDFTLGVEYSLSL